MLRIGLIGLGEHGSRYARHIVDDLPDAALVAVCQGRHTEGTKLAAAIEASQFRISQPAGSSFLWTRAWTILAPVVVYGTPMTSHSLVSSVRRSPTSPV
jgi:hypothetical protein